MKFKGHLYVLGLLIVIFLAVMFLSTSLQNVSVEYNYEKGVSSIQGNNVKLGSVVVDNQGIVPAKVKLKALTGCTFNNDNSNEIYISYSGANREFIDGYNRPYVEVSANEVKEFSIFANYFPTKSISPGSLVIETFTLYLFETNPEDLRYEYCLGADKKDALTSIEVEVQNG